MDKDEWVAALNYFFLKSRRTAPLPAMSDLTGLDETECQIFGGDFIGWWQNWFRSVLLPERRVFGLPDEPIVIHTSTMPGLVALREIVGASPKGIVYLTAEEYAEFLNDNPDDRFQFHIHRWSYFAPIAQDQREAVAATHPGEQVGDLRQHVYGELWGPDKGRELTYLWKVHGEELELLEGAFATKTFDSAEN